MIDPTSLRPGYLVKISVHGDNYISNLSTGLTITATVIASNANYSGHLLGWLEDCKNFAKDCQMSLRTTQIRIGNFHHIIKNWRKFKYTWFWSCHIDGLITQVFPIETDLL